MELLLRSEPSQITVIFWDDQDTRAQLLIDRWVHNQLLVGAVVTCVRPLLYRLVRLVCFVGLALLQVVP